MEEWAYPLSGMRYPPPQDATNLRDYDAARLFIEHAQRVKRDFSADEEGEAIARICQLVEGMPLGIELAASWLRVVSPSDIVKEIERNLDFLETGTRNVPERHRSMRAVFDESWRLLAEEERPVFARLSVFQGSFTREAAEEVAGASLGVLTALVDKSLLKQTSAGMYQVHELLRQYAAAKLDESGEDVDELRNAHSAYYAHLLDTWSAGIMGPRQLLVKAAVQAQRQNIRTALWWAIEQGRLDDLAKGFQTLHLFWQFDCHYMEAATALEKEEAAIRAAKESPETLALLTMVLVYAGWFDIRLGRLDSAERRLKECQAVYTKLGTKPTVGWASDPATALGVLASIRGDYAEAARCGEIARKTAEESGNPGNKMLACYVQCRGAFLQGRYEEARAHIEEAYATCVAEEELWFRAYCHIELGNIACVMGNRDSAREHFQASYDIRKEFEDAEGMAIALTYLGEVAWEERSFRESRDLYEQAVELYQDIHDKGGLAGSYCGMGKAAVAMEDYEAARESFRRSLELAASIEFVPQMLAALAGVGQMLAHRGEPDGARDLLALVAGHAASDHETKQFAERQLRNAELDATASGGIEGALAALSGALGTDVRIRPLLERPATMAGTAAGNGGAGTSYPDELTEREVEVLRLVAQGMSNKDIAEALFITTNTVANHVKNILSKTGKTNRTEAAAYAIERDLT
jgi:DNA-binding CsgD family transcriptional regulator/tetratricopeptide (TPR) repeat protein